MKKKLIAVLSAICMALVFCPMAFADLAPIPKVETPSMLCALIIAAVVIIAAIVGIVLARNKIRRK